ncbi:hypothetical protein Elgi_37060 [Paenibacillus elgii]|nr:hypothetical protein Elgi_37060 [Paenibacillus elgii]
MNSIRNDYPEVSSIRTKYNFYDSETDKLTREIEERELNLDHIKQFHVDCICWECVNGGYDLNTIVRMSIQDKLPHVAGKMSCQGWQDRQRINKHRCYTKLEYFFTFTYHN